MVVFVTAYYEIYPPNSNNKSKEMRFENFSKLAKTKIPMLVFTDKSSMESFSSFKNESNISLVNYNFNFLETYKETIASGVSVLPDKRCPKKDTLEFMILMNAKAEFMKLATEIYPEETHFIWIDFSILYVFKDVDNSIEYLRQLSQKSFQPSCFVVPGCWEKGTGSSYFWNTINWRFCGGFFLADKKSILNFYNLYRNVYKNILINANRMTWETNIWHMFELDYGWKPDWFKADHDDSICKIPEKWIL